MNRLDRYIVGAIFGFTGIVGLALVAIYSFISFVSDIDQIGKGDYGIVQLLMYTLLQMPVGLQTLLPIIALLGTLLGLGMLAGQSELTAMRAAGYSNLRIGRAALIAGLLLGLFGLLLGDWVAPLGQRTAEQLRTTARYGSDSGQALKPVWLRDGAHIFYIRRLVAEDHIADLEIYTLTDDLKLRSVAAVDDARYADGHWQFSGVRRTLFEQRAAKTETLQAQEWTSGLSPEVLRLFVLQAQSLSSKGLYSLIHYLDENGLDSSSQRLSLWRKLVAPLTVMAMTLFAVPFVFGPQRGGGAGQKLLIGVLVGVGFYVINEVSASLGELFAWSPGIAAGLPTLALALAGYARLLRAR